MIINLIFCLLTLFQIEEFRPVPHSIYGIDLGEPWNIHNATIHNSVYFLEDSDLSPLEAFDKYIKGDFAQIKGRAKFNEGYQTSDWWFGITKENPTDKEQLYGLAPYNAAIFKVNFFEFDDQGNLVDTDSAGYSIPVSLGNSNARNDFTAAIFPPKSRKYFLMKIDYNGGRSGTVFFLVSSFFSQLEDVWRGYYEGHFIGIYTAVVAIAFLGFLFFRKKVFLYLSAYSFCGLVNSMDNDRILYLILGDEVYTLLGSWLFPLNFLLWMLFIILFSIEIFKVFGKRVRLIPGLYPIINLQFAFLILLVGSHFFFESKQLVFFYSLCHYLGFLDIALFLVFCVLQVKVNPGLTAFVFFSKVLLVIDIGLVFFIHLGSTLILPIELYFIQFGLMLDLLLITSGMLYNYFSSQEEKNQLLMEQTETEKKILRLSIEAQDKERQRIAKDLHDDLGSNLAMIKLRTEMLLENQKNGNSNSLREIHSMLDGACKDLRYISHELMPADLSTKVMRTMIEELVEKLSVQHKVAIKYHVDDIPTLPIDTKVNLFRIIKELMNNVLKHAQASEAAIQLFHIPNSPTIVLEISDNGKGMPKEVLEGKSNGMGLKNLEKRVEYLKGTLNIQSSGLGTSVQIEVPLGSNQINSNLPVHI